MSVQIHGKEYITVDERVAEFHNMYPNGMIVTKLLKVEDSQILFKAKAIPDVDKPERFYTGHAEEVVGSNQINKTSALENCETSAVGRCLGFLNIGLVGSIASADEVTNAKEQQMSIKQMNDSGLMPIGKYKGMTWYDAYQKSENNGDNYFDWIINISSWEQEWKDKAQEVMDKDGEESGLEK